MAWFCNRFRCERCSHEWADEWSSMCDDDCPMCGARHMSPCESDDLTEIVEQRAHLFVVLRSSETAEQTPDYERVASFSTLKLAEAYMHTALRVP